MPGVSVVVNTLNEETNLVRVLESVKWADEIIIIDDKSDNHFLELVKPFTNKMFVHQLTDFASQRNVGLAHAKGDWILYIDPDERVTKELADEIRSIIATDKPGQPVAYAIPRRNFFLGKEQKQVGGWPDYVVRLLKKDTCEGWQGKVHEQPHYQGSLGHLKQPFIHQTHMDITSMTQKTLAWSQLEAALRLQVGHPRMTSWRFLRMLLTTLFDWYIKKGGYKGGTEGTIESIFQTFSVFFSYAHLWELQQNPSLAKRYEQIDEHLVASGFTSI